MSKSATQRREEKLAKVLRALAVTNPTHLTSTWKKLLDGWSLEAIRRGRLLQQDNLESHHLMPVWHGSERATSIIFRAIDNEILKAGTVNANRFSRRKWWPLLTKKRKAK